MAGDPVVIDLGNRVLDLINDVDDSRVGYTALRVSWGFMQGELASQDLEP